MDYQRIVEHYKASKYAQAYRNLYLTEVEEPENLETLLNLADIEIEKALGSMTTMGKERGFQIGTVRNNRKKVSMHPPKWVDLTTGRSHDDHNTDEGAHHKIHDDKRLMTIKKRVLRSATKNMDKVLHKNAEALFDRYLQERMHAKNFMSAAQGPEAMLASQGHKIADRAKDYKDQFIDFVKRGREATALGEKKKKEQANAKTKFK